MEYQLSTKLTKVNFKWLIENCTEKKYWCKEWLIYDYDNLEIKLRLNRIDIRRNELDLEIHSCLHEGKKNRTYSTSVYLPMDAAHYNENVFKKKLYSAIHRAIVGIEEEKIKETSEYRDAYRNDEEYYERFTEALYERLDEMGIFDQEVRESYVGDKQYEFSFNLSNAVLSEMKYTMLSRCYLMLALMFEYDGEYQYFLKNSELDQEELNLNMEYERINFEEMIESI